MVTIAIALGFGTREKPMAIAIAIPTAIPMLSTVCCHFETGTKQGLAPNREAFTLRSFHPTSDPSAAAAQRCQKEAEYTPAWADAAATGRH